MHTIHDVIEMVDGYRAQYPWLKVKVTDQTIWSASELETTHGINAWDELYFVFKREIEVELKTAALVKLGVPFEEAFDAMQRNVPEY